MEKGYEKIYTNDVIYVPPHAEHSACLEVQLGCSWGRCTFCDFARDTYVVHPLEKVEENLKILSRLQPCNEYLFLLGENAFGLPFSHLNQIMDLAGIHMPQVRFFSMYSRADDVLRKSPAELRALKRRGVYALHMGVESGSDSVLAARRKGITAEGMKEAFDRLDAAGIAYLVTIIPGLGGKALSRAHALETAGLLNTARPVNIWCLKLKLWEGTPLFEAADKGTFEPMTDREMLTEERLLIENLRVDQCLFEDTTVLNRYTIQGRLQSQKKQLLEAVDLLLSREDCEEKEEC